jgi:diguanylate cyclase (GGDEF)-like protein/putative nucleotidyltransferase with HDIG domain
LEGAKLGSISPVTVRVSIAFRCPFLLATTAGNTLARVSLQSIRLAVALVCLGAGLTLVGAFAAHPLTRLLALSCIAGLFGYTLFVGRVMWGFNSPQVVPERVRQALDTLAEGLLVMDERATVILANRAFAQTVNVPAEQLVDSCANDLPWRIAECGGAEQYPWMRAIDESATITEQILHLSVGGEETRIFSVNAAPLGGGNPSQRGALATFRDVTHIEEHRAELERMLSMLRASRDEIEQKNRELEILATQDALTGCMNRRAFFEKFARLWQETKEQATPLSCIMIDNDHFKCVNDTYGHAVGDEVLRQVARVLHEHHSGHGLVCRYGGEEFCVLLPGFSYEQAIELAEQTRQAVAEIRLDAPPELQLTASIGVSETRYGAADPQELINQADLCLYAAKRNGRNCVVPYTEQLEQIEVDADEKDDRTKIEIPYQAVHALLASLAFRDACTANHSRRVAELCLRVAKDCGQPVDRDLLEIAALLHDIGKICVPDDILLKCCELTDAEQRLIADHDRIGVELIDDAFDCAPLTEIVRHANTPYNTPGRRLPIGARLLAICERYDELVFAPSSSCAGSHQQAVEQLRRQAGTRFDPHLVEHFAEVIRHAPEESEHHVARNMAAGISFQIERLATAIEDQDSLEIRSLASRLVRYARRCEVETVAVSAERIHDQASREDVGWLELIKEAQQLMQFCREALTTDRQATPPPREKQV